MFLSKETVISEKGMLRHKRYVELHIHKECSKLSSDTTVGVSILQ